MSKHHPDLLMCRKQPGTTVGRLCEKCEGKCVICDSLVRQTTLAHICDECNYGSFQVRTYASSAAGLSLFLLVEFCRLHGRFSVREKLILIIVLAVCVFRSTFVKRGNVSFVEARVLVTRIIATSAPF